MNGGKELRWENYFTYDKVNNYIEKWFRKKRRMKRLESKTIRRLCLAMSLNLVGVVGPTYLQGRQHNPALPLTALMHIPVLPPIQPNSTQRHENGHLRGRKAMRC